jgi:hypothetical protein
MNNQTLNGLVEINADDIYTNTLNKVIIKVNQSYTAQNARIKYENKNIVLDILNIYNLSETFDISKSNLFKDIILCKKTVMT